MTFLRTLGRLALEGTDLTRPQPLLLLTYLRLEGPVSREHVARLFWPSHDRGRKNLSMALVRLREAHADAVEEVDDQLESRVECDAIRFLDACRAGELEEALTRYAGPFLPDAPGSSGGAELEEWVLARREAFARHACRAHLEMAARALERGDTPAAARAGGEALRLVRDHAITEPEVLERLHRLLQQVASPDAAETARFLAELDVDPPSATSVPPLGISHLELIGRADDVARVEAALAGGRASVVTITGAAGVGKTSLAHEVAHRAVAAGRYSDGVRSVPLESVRESAEVVGRIARALGVADASDAIAAIRAALRERNALVLLDNFEHVMDAAADLARIAGSLPGPSFLVTSRSRLQLRGEVEVGLEPLSTSSSDRAPSAAAELFMDRARRSSRGFGPDADQLAAIEDICRRLDGLPLAIELAAAHVRAFSLPEIRAMLDDRFELLRGGYRDAPDRQRSLVAAIDWSYQLLPPLDQQVFRHLAVFRGSFDLAGAAAVARRPPAEVAPALTKLAEHHLVKPEASSGATTRFRCLESVRAYAGRRLAQAAEAAEAERAHARRLAEVVESATEAAPSTTTDVGRSVLAREADNLRGALAWCRESGDVELGRRIVRHAWRFWLERGDLREARAWLDAFVPGPPGSGPGSEGARAGDVDVELRRALCTVLHELGEFEAARRELEVLRASLAAEDARRPGVEVDLAWVLAHLGELTLAERVARSAEAAIDPDAEPRAAALVENDLGWIALYRGDAGAARRRFERSLALRRSAGDERGGWFAEVNRAWADAGGTGAFGGPGLSLAAVPRADEDAVAAAIARCARAGDALRDIEDAQLTAWADTVYAELAVAAGRASEVVEDLPEVVAAWRRVGNADGLALAFEALAGARLAAGDPRGAGSAAEEALRIRDRSGNRWGRARVRLQLALAAVALGDDAAAARLREAREMATALGHRWFPAACGEALARLGEA